MSHLFFDRRTTGETGETGEFNRRTKRFITEFNRRTKRFITEFITEIHSRDSSGVQL